MKRNHRQPAAGHQQLFGRSKSTVEFAEFVVDGYTQGLERPSRWVLPGLGCGHDRTHHGGELKGPPERLMPLSRADRTGDPTGEALLAELADEFRELPFRQGSDQIGSSLTFAAHPHIERPVKAKRKAAFRLVELDRRDPEIESNAGDRAAGYGSEQADHLAETALDDGQPSAVPLGQLASVAYRFRVAVECDHSAPRCGEQCRAVAAASKGGVDIKGVVTRGQRREHGIDKHGDMRRPWAELRTPRLHFQVRVVLALLDHERGRLARLPSDGILIPSRRVRSSKAASCAANRSGSQIWNVDPSPTNAALSVICACAASFSGRTIRPSGSKGSRSERARIRVARPCCSAGCSSALSPADIASIVSMPVASRAS